MTAQAVAIRIKRVRCPILLLFLSEHSALICAISRATRLSVYAGRFLSPVQLASKEREEFYSFAIDRRTLEIDDYAHLSTQARLEVCPSAPDTSDESLSTATENKLLLPLLSDVGSAIAKSCGIAFKVPEELRPVYARFRHPLPDIDGDESLVLPIPATYVIGRDGIVALAFLDVDYRNRPEPSDVLTALRALSKESKGIVMSCSKNLVAVINDSNLPAQS